MKPSSLPQPIYHLNKLNRRGFMKGCAACTALLTAGPLWTPPAMALSAKELYPDVKPRIRLVFAHRSADQATWPNIGYDYAGRIKELTAMLQRDCPMAEFSPVTVMNNDEAKKILEKDAEVDGYLVYLVGLWTGAAMAMAESGKPTIFIDDPYAGSGEFLIAYAGAKRKGMKVIGVSSSDWQDTINAVRCLDCIKKMQASNILDVTENQKAGWANPEKLAEFYGPKLQFIGSDEINGAYDKVRERTGKEWADQWIENAERVVEPTREEILK